MRVLQSVQSPEGSLQVESSRKTGVLVYKISWETFSATSRREITRRDVICTSLCHVATWSYTSRRQKLHLSVTSRCGCTRRDVDVHVATSFLTPLCHVATWMYTSRRGCTRRDVNWYNSLSRRDVAPHVATSFGHVLCHVAT